MTFGEYLASIDWFGAVVVAAVAVAVGSVVLRFLLASTSEVGHMVPGAGSAAGKAILDARTGMLVDSWICSECQSVNTPQARYCYRGCGTREEIARTLPEDLTVIAAGHNGRRNT